MQSFNVKTASYEGPLELLLDLIEKRKLLINEISLAAIADDFIGYMKGHEHFPVDQSSEFILTASTLLLIKSRSLLPGITLTAEEEQSIGDLENRLAHYKRIKELSKHLEERFGKKLMFSRVGGGEKMKVFLPDHDTNVSAILQSLKEVLARIRKTEKLPEATVRKIISLEEMIARLAKRVEETISTSFRNFAGGNTAEKVDIIVSFLAMLELVKRGVIMAKQESDFGDIELHKEEVGVPTYN